MLVKWLLSTGIVLALATPVIIAQSPGTGQRLYDPSTEVTVSGSIEDIQQHTGRRGRWTGTHLVLKTDSGVFNVHVRPSSYISRQQFSLVKGDTVQVVGSKVTVHGQEALLAREISKDGKTLTLRNAQGIPQWSAAAAITDLLGRNSSRSFTEIWRGHGCPRRPCGSCWLAA